MLPHTLGLPSPNVQRCVRVLCLFSGCQPTEIPLFCLVTISVKTFLIPHNQKLNTYIYTHTHICIHSQCWYIIWSIQWLCVKLIRILTHTWWNQEILQWVDILGPFAYFGLEIHSIFFSRHLVSSHCRLLHTKCCVSQTTFKTQEPILTGADIFILWSFTTLLFLHPRASKLWMSGGWTQS